MSTAISEFRRDNSPLYTREEVTQPPADLLGNVTERQEALFRIQCRLYNEARKASRLAKYMRVAVIVLGAFAATREVADRLFVNAAEGETNKVPIVVVYTLMALAITAIGSISAALGIADKASGLGSLAAECNTHILKVDCEMPCDGEHSARRHAAEVRKLIQYQNEKISAIQGKAAKLGVLVPGLRLNCGRAAQRTAE